MKKLENLKNILRNLERVAIAFSGGVDSTFLLKISIDILGNKNVLAITANSNIRKKGKVKNAVRLASSIGSQHIIINTEELREDNFKNNPVNRCYYCKKLLFKNIKEYIKDKNIKYIIEGTNYDDIDEFRPGLKAVEEFKVISPLKDAKFTKAEIRKLSKKLDLETWNKTSDTCLATRIPYNSIITENILERVEKAENILKSSGIKIYRVRDHGDIARVEILRKDFNLFLKKMESEKIVYQLKKLGYTFVTLDLEGYKGSVS